VIRSDLFLLWVLSVLLIWCSESRLVSSEGADDCCDMHSGVEVCDMERLLSGEATICVPRNEECCIAVSFSYKYCIVFVCCVRSLHIDFSSRAIVVVDQDLPSPIFLHAIVAIDRDFPYRRLLLLIAAFFLLLDFPLLNTWSLIIYVKEEIESPGIAEGAIS